MDKHAPLLADVTRWLIGANAEIQTIKPATYNDADTLTNWLTWLPGFLDDIVEQAQLLKQRVEEVRETFTGPTL